MIYLLNLHFYYEGEERTVRAMGTKLTKIDEDKQSVKDSLKSGPKSAIWQELEQEFEDDVEAGYWMIFTHIIGTSRCEIS